MDVSLEYVWKVVTFFFFVLFSFLDNRVFVTCSDDTTVRLWDARNLTNELKVLRGHTSWVKNIEYCSTAGKLITSGFDGNVFAWDINK